MKGEKFPIPSRACCVDPSTEVDLYKALEPLAGVQNSTCVHIRRVKKDNPKSPGGGGTWFGSRS